MQEKSSRIIGLDIVRTFAIILVVFVHSFFMFSPFLSNWIVHLVYAILLWIGPMGVELFFTLSGFLIGRILINTYLLEDKFTFASIRTFWIRRWFRTLPLYFAILLFSIAISTNQLSDVSVTPYFFFLQNFSNPIQPFFVVSWSLSIEEWFYLTLPVFIYITGRIFRSRTKKSILTITFLSYTALILLLRLVRISLLPVNDFHLEIQTVVIYRLDAIMYGVLCAYLIEFYKERIVKLKKTLFIISFVGLLLTTFLLWAGTKKTTFLSSHNIYQIVFDSLYLSIIPGLFSLVLPLAYSKSEIRSKKLTGIFKHVSTISYSMYLVHYQLIYIPLFSQLEQSTNTGLLKTLLYFLLYWVLVVAAANITYRLIEKPTLAFRDRFS